MTNCPHCGMIHQTTCHRIKAIEYNQDGVTVKRIEFHAPQAVVVGPPDIQNLRILRGPSNSYGAAGQPSQVRE